MTDKFRTLSLLILATLSGMSLWFMTAAILPDMAAEAGLAAGALAHLSTAVQAGFVAGALLVALTGAADRLDPRRVLFAASLLTAASTAALALVPIGGSAAFWLRFASGAAMAGVYPVGMKIAVGWGQRDRGFLVGLLVGALTAGKSVPFLLAWLGGADWRLALIWGAVLAAIGGGAVLFTALGPHHARATTFRASAIALAWTDRSIRAAILGYLGHMWELFALWAWIGVAATASYAMRMPTEEAVSLGKLTGFVAILAAAPICLAAGLWADRIGKGRVAAIALAVSGTSAVLTAIAFGGPVWLVFLLFLVWGAAVVPDSAQFSALVADHAPPHLVGSLMTFQTSLGFLLTVATVQVTPMIAEAWGWPALLALLALGPVFGIWGLRPVLGERPGAGQARTRSDFGL